MSSWVPQCRGICGCIWSCQGGSGGGVAIEVAIGDGGCMLMHPDGGGGGHSGGGVVVVVVVWL